MKVCAHIVLGPYNFEYKSFANVKEAADYFENEVVGTDFGTGTAGQAMDLYTAPDECPCNSYMNFHDFVELRFVAAADGTPVLQAV